MTQTIADYKMSRKQALEQGFIIHSSSYPNFAYKGDPINPTESHAIPTEREEPFYQMLIGFAKICVAGGAAVLALGEFQKVIATIDIGDFIERNVSDEHTTS